MAVFSCPEFFLAGRTFGPKELSLVNEGLTSTQASGTITFAGTPYGADPGSNRFVIVLVSGLATSGNTNLDASVVWGGVTISKIVDRQDVEAGTGGYVGIFAAVVPTGAAGDLDITIDDTIDAFTDWDRIVVTTMVTDQIGSTTAFDTGSADANDSVNIRVDNQANGFVVMVATHYVSTVLGDRVDFKSGGTFIASPSVDVAGGTDLRHLIYFIDNAAANVDELTVIAAGTTRINVAGASWL